MTMICRKCKKEIPEGSVYCNICGAKQEISRNPKKRGNGTGTVWKLPSGKWIATRMVMYKDADGVTHRKTKSRTFAKRSDAIMALPSIWDDAPAREDLNLAQLWDLYSRSREYDALSDSQRAKMRYAWARYADVSTRTISSLTVSDIEDVIDDQTESFYPAHDMKVLLSHLYEIAIKREIVTINKTAHVDLPYPSPKAKREVWTDAEVAALWDDYAAHPFTGYILVMCYTGMRFGELSTIPLDRIYLDESYMVWGSKSDAGRDREIPIASRIAPVIRALAEGRSRKLLEMNKDNFYARYWETIDRLGLRHLPPHTCRHYFFSRLTAAGVQGGMIAEVGGHANYLTTLKNYVRVPIADKLKAVDAI